MVNIGNRHRHTMAKAMEESNLTMMETMDENPTIPPKGNGKPVSLTGFVLKLYNMVNGAPDDVVSVSLKNAIVL